MITFLKSLSKGSANPTWPTTPFSKYVHGLTYSAFRVSLIDDDGRKPNLESELGNISPNASPAPDLNSLFGDTFQNGEMG